MDLFGSIGSVLNAITDNSFTGKLLISGAAVGTAFFTPIVGLLFACFVLNISDLISGIKAARAQGQAITSRKTWRGTIRKLIQECELITLLHVIEHFAFSSFDVSTTMLSGGATILICLTEVWSVLENMNRINPKGPWRIIEQFLEHKGEQLTGVEIDLNENGTVNNIKPIDCKRMGNEE